MSEEQKKETTFEQSLARLERIVSEMEGGTLPLDDMMKRFEEGRVLVAECTKQRIEKVTSAVPPAVEPMNIL